MLLFSLVGDNTCYKHPSEQFFCTLGRLFSISTMQALSKFVYNFGVNDSHVVMSKVTMGIVILTENIQK